MADGEPAGPGEGGFKRPPLPSQGRPPARGAERRPGGGGQGREGSEGRGAAGQGEGAAEEGHGSAGQGHGSAGQGEGAAEEGHGSAGQGSPAEGKTSTSQGQRSDNQKKMSSTPGEGSVGPDTAGEGPSAHQNGGSEGEGSAGQTEGSAVEDDGSEDEKSEGQGGVSVGQGEGSEGTGGVSVGQGGVSDGEGSEGTGGVSVGQGEGSGSPAVQGMVEAGPGDGAAGPGRGPAGSSQRASAGASLVRQKATGRPLVIPKTTPPIPYHEPPWAALPPAGDPYNLETLKNGVIMSSLRLAGQSWFVFGRLPGCDVSLEHPSVSRYHAVLQYRGAAGTEDQQDRGFYVYDLDSTHGTFVNKKIIPPKTYCRLRVGHVMKLGGSTRLFILQGPDEDQESESELSVTQLMEARRQQQRLQEKMLGDDLDTDTPEEEPEELKPESGASNDAGCSWGMGDDAEEEGETEENPIAIEFQEEREAFYVKDPKKALQGFFDREGEELEYEYDDHGHNTWLCRVRLPGDDAGGKQLIAEAIHSGKKKEAMIQCALEACRMLDIRGLLRQEAVSRKRKSKNWEEEDFYDSDDDTFLDRTGSVEQKRIIRMKKAGRIEEKPETYDSLVSKLNVVKYELSEIAEKLKPSRTGQSQTATQDSLDAFMKEIRSGDALDSVTRKKLHLKSFELKKEQRRLEVLIKIVKPTALPELKPHDSSEKPKKLTLPMFGAMKGGKKCKLKTGAIGSLPPQRTNLPSSLFNMKGGGSEPEEEEEEEEEDHTVKENDFKLQNSEMEQEAKEEDLDQSLSPLSRSSSMSGNQESTGITCQSQNSVDESKSSKKALRAEQLRDGPVTESQDLSPESKSEEKLPKVIPGKKKKKVYGPSRPPRNTLSTSYPEDDPDYCVWTPPAGQSGDGKTHLNEKYGY